MFLLLMCFFFFVLWGLLLTCNKAVISFVLSLTLSHLFFVAYCYGFRPQAAQWQNTSQILSLHDPAQQQSYTCTHVEQTRMVGCSQKVICPGCSVSLWVRVRVRGFFCAFAVEDTWEWVFAYVRLFASQVPLPLWRVSEVTWPQEARSLRWPAVPEMTLWQSAW